MRRISTLLTLVMLTACVASPTRATLASPLVGWKANLSTLAHGVSGSVTILDDDTVRVDNFTYDGGGIIVYFYLAPSNSYSSFKDNGLGIGNDIKGTSFDGTQGPFTIDLPGASTVEGYHGVSVWCVTANANFGSGTFAPVPIGGDYSGNGILDAADYVAWRDAMTSGSSLMNDVTPLSVGTEDYDYWREHFGNTSLSGAGAGDLEAPGPVPEPATIALAECALGLLLFDLRARNRLLR